MTNGSTGRSEDQTYGRESRDAGESQYDDDMNLDSDLEEDM